MSRLDRGLLGAHLVRIRIWGCRGSIASPGPDTVRYGGNTSCVEVRLSDGSLLLLDAGTGARPLGIELMRDLPPRIDLLLTHLHVDHVEGLGAFEPIWSPDTELHVWGPPSPVASLDERVATYFSPPLFPVHLYEVPARTVFHDVDDEAWSVGSATIWSQPIMHAGQTVGYRIRDADGVVLTYLTDHEPALGSDLRSLPGEWISGFGLASRADVLIHDCQYTPEEYVTRVGFGHSSTEHVAVFAARTEVGRLVMFHHDPLHGDDELEAMRGELLERWPVEPDRCVVAAEGETLEA
jgi:phosphoribosyl 1,2-cyclic phosphodiesterase